MEADVMSESGEHKETLSAAPAAQKKTLKFSFFEPIAGIIFAIVATFIFYFFPQIITIVFIGGRLIPTFDEVVIQSLWLPLLIWVVLRVGVEVAYLIERRYTQRLALVAVIGNFLAIIATFFIFFSDRIVFWEYIDFVHRYFADVAEWFGEVLARPNLIILVVIVLVLIIESFTVVKKGNKAKKLEEKAEANRNREAKAEESE